MPPKLNKELQYDPRQRTIASLFKIGNKEKGITKDTENPYQRPFVCNWMVSKGIVPKSDNLTKNVIDLTDRNETSGLNGSSDQNEDSSKGSLSEKPASLSEKPPGFSNSGESTSGMYPLYLLTIPEIKTMRGRKVISSDPPDVKLDIVWAGHKVNNNDINKLEQMDYGLCTSHIFVCIPSDVDRDALERGDLEDAWKFYFRLPSDKFVVIPDRILENLIPERYARLDTISDKNIQRIKDPDGNYIVLPVLPPFIFRKRKSRAEKRGTETQVQLESAMHLETKFQHEPQNQAETGEKVVLVEPGSEVKIPNKNRSQTTQQQNKEQYLQSGPIPQNTTCSCCPEPFCLATSKIRSGTKLLVDTKVTVESHQRQSNKENQAMSSGGKSTQKAAAATPKKAPPKAPVNNAPSSNPKPETHTKSNHSVASKAPQKAAKVAPKPTPASHQRVEIDFGMEEPPVEDKSQGTTKSYSEVAAFDPSDFVEESGDDEEQKEEESGANYKQNGHHDNSTQNGEEGEENGEEEEEEAEGEASVGAEEDDEDPPTPPPPKHVESARSKSKVDNARTEMKVQETKKKTTANKAPVVEALHNQETKKKRPTPEVPPKKTPVPSNPPPTKKTKTNAPQIQHLSPPPPPTTQDDEPVDDTPDENVEDEEQEQNQQQQEEGEDEEEEEEDTRWTPMETESETPITKTGKVKLSQLAQSVAQRSAASREAGESSGKKRSKKDGPHGTKANKDLKLAKAKVFVKKGFSAKKNAIMASKGRNPGLTLANDQTLEDFFKGVLPWMMHFGPSIDPYLKTGIKDPLATVTKEQLENKDTCFSVFDKQEFKDFAKVLYFCYGEHMDPDEFDHHNSRPQEKEPQGEAFTF
jgi:hypothetical protein